MTFGEFVREKRLARDLSLRKFCETAQLDPSNWSKIERGRFPAPTSREALEHIAKVLGLVKATDDWLHFFDLASITQQRIPEELYADKEVLDVLPIFFRTVRGDKPKKKDLQKLIDLLKNR